MEHKSYYPKTGLTEYAVLIGTFVTLFNQFQLVPEFHSMFAVTYLILFPIVLKIYDKSK